MIVTVLEKSNLPILDTKSDKVDVVLAGLKKKVVKLKCEQ